MSEIGDYIKQIREELGLSQQGLTLRSGVSRSYISRLEHGERVNMSSRMIAALAQGLGVTVSELAKRAGLDVTMSGVDGQVLYYISRLDPDSMHVVKATARALYERFGNVQGDVRYTADEYDAAREEEVPEGDEEGRE